MLRFFPLWDAPPPKETIRARTAKAALSRTALIRRALDRDGRVDAGRRAQRLGLVGALPT